MSSFNEQKKIGILGAGQLGKMLAQSVSPWDVGIQFMDKEKGMAASLVAGGFVTGDITAYADVMGFGRDVDVLGIEIEHVDVDALKRLSTEGIKIYPRPEALEIIKDKGLQKKFYSKHKIPTAPYSLWDSKNHILEGINRGAIVFPFVQKARKDGYDGKGVVVIKSANDIEKMLEAPSLVEQMIDIKSEVSVIACRDHHGNIECFPVVEMEFDHEANLVKYLFCPADITVKMADDLIELSRKIIKHYDIEGLLAIEFFINHQDQILVNEVAPRPHNSGHHTIESMNVSQFNQHMRAMMGLPLIKPKIYRAAVMINLLGEPDHEGPVMYEGIEHALKHSGVHIHLYGKKMTRPKRKMGHVTITADTLEEAKEKAIMIENLIKVKTQ